jgi:parallel beta-helix repeat protein
VAEVIRYINTASAGGDGTTNNEAGATAAYATAAAWEAAEETDLDAAGNWMHALSSTGSGTTADGKVDVVGWTTSAASYISFEANTGHFAVKDKWDPDIYRMEYTDNHVMRIQEDYVRVNGIQIKHTYSGTANRHALNIVFVGTGDIRVSNCRIQADTNATGNAVALRVSDADAVVSFWNNIIEGGDVAGILVSAASGSKIYNNDVYGSTLAGIELDTTSTVKNNAVSATTTDIQDDAGDSTIDYNASDDGTGTNAQTIIAIGNEFTDAPGGNFTLLSGGVCESNGVGPGTDANVQTPDIDGTTRAGATCDIGADELVAAGGDIVILRRRRS